MPLSESLELAERPETDETDEAVETERSSCGTALRASEGEIHGSGEEARSRGGEGVESMGACGRCGECAQCRVLTARKVELSCVCLQGEVRWRASPESSGRAELVVGACKWLLW